jgi:hypothetical protein
MGTVIKALILISLSVRYPTEIKIGRLSGNDGCGENRAPIRRCKMALGDSRKAAGDGPV